MAQTHDDTLGLCDDVLDELRRAVDNENLAVWNDRPERAHSDVLNLLDLVITRLT